jgi:Spy/CpxP family protein refolding chaperone
MTVSLKSLVRVTCTLGLLAGLLAAPAIAQPPGGGGRGGAGGFNFLGGGGGILGLLANEDVKKELELLDDQTSKIEAIQAEMRTAMGEIFQSGDREGMAAKMTELRKKSDEDVAKVLDSDQLKRVKQIEFQQAVGRGMGGVAAGIVSDQVVADLGLTKEQVEQLTEAQKGADEEYRKKLAAARAEALDKLVATLSPEQQAKFKELYGKPFELRINFGGGGAGGGGRGQGGPGGGGRGGRQRPNSDRDL